MTVIHPPADVLRCRAIVALGRAHSGEYGRCRRRIHEGYPTDLCPKHSEQECLGATVQRIPPPRPKERKP
jgi:hypothetical protein